MYHSEEQTTDRRDASHVELCRVWVPVTPPIPVPITTGGMIRGFGNSSATERELGYGILKFGVRRYRRRTAARPGGGTTHRHRPRFLACERHGRYHPRRSSAGAAYGPHPSHRAAREAASAQAASRGAAAGGPPANGSAASLTRLRPGLLHAAVGGRGEGGGGARLKIR